MSRSSKRVQGALVPDPCANCGADLSKVVDPNARVTHLTGRCRRKKRSGFGKGWSRAPDRHITGVGAARFRQARQERADRHHQ